MTLFKTSILSFIATIVKLLAGLVINKAMAIYVGANGLALIGQFQNFSQLVMTIAQGGINSGVVKYTAEYGKDSSKIPILFSTASKISLSTSVIVGFGVVLFSKVSSVVILKNDDYAYIFVIFGFTIILFVINGLLLSILNGLKEIKTFIKINIIQSLYSLVFTTTLIVFLGIEGALIALVTNQSVVLIVVLYMLRTHPIVKISNFNNSFHREEGGKLIKFSAMAITSAIVVPVSHLIVRDYIGESIGWKEAGYWQAIWYVSTMYLMLVTTTLSIYYLPRLSEITDKRELKSELLNGYKIIMPIVIASVVIIYFLRNFIIILLFTEDFAPMNELFLYQLVGDVIKIASWLLAYLMLAKAMTKVFIVTEVIFSIMFILFSIALVDYFGLVGMTYAYTLNYSLYFIAVIIMTRKILK